MRDFERSQQHGFTLIELLIVMGILSGFLLMLVQLVDSGLRTFRDGETSQILADRSSHAQRVITEELTQLRGSATTRDSERVEDRLVVQLLPIGLPVAPEQGASRSQILRAAVHLLPDRELRIIDMALVGKILAEDPTMPPEKVRAEVEQRRINEPLRGVGNVMLMVARQEGADDALIELRAGWFLPGQKFPAGPNRLVDPFEAIIPGSEELPGSLLREITEPVLQNLLHVEFSFWAQGTTAWANKSGVLGAVLSRSSAGGNLQAPQGIWDSARGGWLVDEISGGAFAYDVGPFSENDTSDDIHPHAIMVRCAVAQPADATPEGLLSGFIASDSTSLELYDGTSFPGAFDGGFIKIDGEWMRYNELSGDRLIGLRRGERGTKAISHESGTQVHVGRTIEFVVPILHAKDDWNG
ncbi:MAG: prepilin-type N-terminal cleavage/methylation domain-containing protein [Hyphomicrobiaceae bacterium]|jgi:prepilin-type N-terminal cleavage/methylation domain-containing protein